MNKCLLERHVNRFAVVGVIHSFVRWRDANIAESHGLPAGDGLVQIFDHDADVEHLGVRIGRRLVLR